MNSEISSLSDILARVPTQLPTPTSLGRRALQICEQAEPSAEQLAELVMHDPGLTLRLLRFVNSPLYGGGRGITRVSQAISTIGLRPAQLLTLGFTPPTDPLRESGLTRAWSYACIGAAIARGLARDFRLADPEEAVSTALLSHVGRLGLICAFPETYAEPAMIAADPAVLRRLEQERFGCDPLALSAVLLEHWQLPGELTHAVQAGANQESGGDAAPLGRIVRLIEKLLPIFVPLCESPDRIEAPLPVDLAEALKCDEASWRYLVYGVVGKYAKAAALLADDPRSSESREELICEAREQAIRIGIENHLEHSQLSQGYASLLSVAGTDPLTGVANRARLEERLAESLREVSRGFYHLGTVLVDLDHFKAINDTHGHQAGDLVLKQVARTLQHGIREVDLLARYGGEEFAILLPNTDPQGACCVVERLRKSVQGLRVEFNGKTIPVTLSAGLAFTGDFPAVPDAGAFIKEADAQLYLSKAAGRNTWHFRGQPALQLRGGALRNLLSKAMAKASSW